MKTSYSLSEFPANAENILELESPETYTCLVFQYGISHSRMTINVHNQSNAVKYKLQFSSVTFFSGLLGWTGANFCIAPFEDYLKIALINNEDAIDNKELEYFKIHEKHISARLLSIPAKEMTIQLVASVVTITQTDIGI